jgi:hypothetical protein
MDRVAALLPGSDNRSPEMNMKRLMSVLSPSVIVPEPDKYYVFVYKAKTPGTTYDQHPFIVCTNIYKWGFTGYNFHWEGVRQYSWAEVLTNLYEVSDEELNSVQRLPIAKIRRS